ncbi:MAG: hypothetical protein ACI4OR_03495 [Alphaproteobacteria bacterium]
MSLNFTFLAEEQIWGDVALEAIKKYGTKAAQTDLARVLGGVTMADCYTSEGDRSCKAWWSRSSYGDVFVQCVNCYGYDVRKIPHLRFVSARPVLAPSEVLKIGPENIHMGAKGVLIVEYGEYPQTIANKETSEKLEKLHKAKILPQTGKKYTFDSSKVNGYPAGFEAETYPEYEMDNKKYVRIPVRDSDSRFEGTPHWVEVQPIEWLMDERRWMIAKKCLFAGIPFDPATAYRKSFSETFIKHYLDTYFAKEIEPSERAASKEVSRDFEEDLKTFKETTVGKDRKGLRQMLSSANKTQKALLIGELTTDTPERKAEFEKATEIRRQRLSKVEHEEWAERCLKAARKERKKADQELAAYRAKRKLERT